MKAGKPEVTEYSGHWVKANQWFSIGLSKEEVAMLKMLREDLYLGQEKHSLADTLRMLVQAAMAHYDVLRGKDDAYGRGEGFATAEDCFAGLIKRQFEAGMATRMRAATN